LIDWLSDDGERLHGALLLPSDYQEGKRYPLVVWVYAGELSSNSLDRFGLVPLRPVNGQLLATRGYAVLLPDSPQHEGTAMADLEKTVLSGVNKVIEMGIADPERLGVMGHSNGGYSTLALIVQTMRFKAAVEMDGTANLVDLYAEMGKDGTAYGTGMLEHGQDAMGGTPWQFRERYIENSPIFYLDRVETPLLIVQATGDPVVATFHGDQIFVALQRLGKEVEYATYEDEGHFPASYGNRLDLLNRMLAWFNKYLKAENH
jgi:dipeptidyl aminopeptidase/acylaminoacyl peptidase